MRKPELADLLLLLIAVLIVCTIYCVINREFVEMPRAFHAWEKLTGNQKHLTYKEWKSLIESLPSEQSETTTLLLLPK